MTADPLPMLAIKFGTRLKRSYEPARADGATIYPKPLLAPANSLSDNRNR